MCGVQALFVLDVALNFNTAFLHQEHWILHRPAIARNYLKGWFWIGAVHEVEPSGLSALRC